MTDLSIGTASLSYYSNFLNKEESDFLFTSLQTSAHWRQDKVKVFGKIYDQPRLCFLVSEGSKGYSYSGLTLPPIPFDSQLLELKRKVEQVSGHAFNSCLVNLYRDGNDSNGWHSDDEKELGPNPIIASISLGIQRNFDLKHKNNPEQKRRIALEHGSLLIMSGRTQSDFKHQLPKSKRITAARINLTFRYIFDSL